MASVGPGLCSQGIQKIRELAEQIAHRAGDHLRLANAIYWVAWTHGGWVGQPGENMDADPSCPELADPGAHFLQLADALEEHQEVAAIRDAYIALIEDSAVAYLEGRPMPDYEYQQDGFPKRT